MLFGTFIVLFCVHLLVLIAMVRLPIRTTERDGSPRSSDSYRREIDLLNVLFYSIGPHALLLWGILSVS